MVKSDEYIELRELKCCICVKDLKILDDKIKQIYDRMIKEDLEIIKCVCEKCSYEYDWTDSFDDECMENVHCYYDGIAYVIAFKKKEISS